MPSPPTPPTSSSTSPATSPLRGEVATGRRCLVSRWCFALGLRWFTSCRLAWLPQRTACRNSRCSLWIRNRELTHRGWAAPGSKRVSLEEFLYGGMGECCRRRRKPDSSTSESINPNERIERLQVLNRSSFQGCSEGISSLFYLSTSVFERLEIGSERALFASASTIASSVAASLNANFQKLSFPDLKQTSLGASGRRVREIWNHAGRISQP